MTDVIDLVRKSAASAALDPALWPETLWHVSQLIGSDMTMFEHVDKTSGRVEFGFSDHADLAAAMRGPYEKHFYAVNSRYEVWRAQPVHATIHGGLLGDERTLDADGVARNTVRTHLAVFRDKLGVRSALAVAAQMRRAVDPFR